jgi:hypothetical protein
VPEDVRLLTARRAYEFRPDDLALATLQLAQTRDKIQAAFSFQAANNGVVPGLFGPTTIQLGQQGIVFQNGTLVVSDRPTPIRLMQIEPTRIVIDVMASSSVIDSVFEHLVGALGDVRTADDHAVIGDPLRIRDFSELSGRFRFSLKDLFPPSVFEAFRRGLGNEAGTPVPAIFFESLPEGQPYGGIPDVQSTTIVRFAPRAGYKPEDQVYYSGALVNTDAHLKYLQGLEAAIVGDWLPKELARRAKGESGRGKSRPS